MDARRGEGRLLGSPAQGSKRCPRHSESIEIALLREGTKGHSPLPQPQRPLWAAPQAEHQQPPPIINDGRESFTCMLNDV